MPAMPDLPRAQQAGILCNDPSFQRFVATRTVKKRLSVGPLHAAEYLRRECGVESRRDLNTDDEAAAKFDALRTDYDAWRGRIARPR